jgi:hypothetical protein
MLAPTGEARAGLGHSKAEEHCRPVGRRRGLCEGAAEEDRLRLRRSLLPRRARGLDEPVDNPVVAGRLADEQVFGDLLVRARCVGNQSGGTVVSLSAFGARELRVDAAADDGVDECQRPARLQDPRGHECFCGFRSLALVEARKPRRLEKVALLEDRQGASESPRMLRQAAQPEANRAPDRSSSDSFDVACGLRRRCDPSFPQRLDEQTHKKRRPTCCAQTGVDEDRVRMGSET